ncbi:hypothetical protein ASF71_19760 [Deinococcus sp. Leaf326]|nr:hypothetical protein ASF71_19760 [Deinococcus sp. Leaf326]
MGPGQSASLSEQALGALVVAYRRDHVVGRELLLEAEVGEDLMGRPPSGSEAAVETLGVAGTEARGARGTDHLRLGGAHEAVKAFLGGGAELLGRVHRVMFALFAAPVVCVRRADCVCGTAKKAPSGGGGRGGGAQPSQ